MNKVKIVFIGIMLGYVLILLSLLRIQFFSANQAADNADYLQKRTIPAKRGVIYDSHGEQN
jgi:cell division protein FtsI/penicillin-binding protein 2